MQYVILSDSDEDWTPDMENRKKQKRLRPNEAENSDDSVIEISSDSEEQRQQAKKNSTAENAGQPTKRRRGRPPKRNLAVAETEGSPQKKMRAEQDVPRTEVRCPYCPKTFPSSNSLATHIHHHDLENNLQKTRATRARAAGDKYKCDMCSETFVNRILLKRHECVNKEKVKSCRRTCDVCKRSFADWVALGVHMRSHVKENLVTSTVVARVSYFLRFFSVCTILFWLVFEKE